MMMFLMMNLLMMMKILIILIRQKISKKTTKNKIIKKKRKSNLKILNNKKIYPKVKIMILIKMSQIRINNKESKINKDYKI